MKLSIRLKFLLAMSSLLLVCLSFYMLMSIAVFKSDKKQLVYDLNRSQVTTLANELTATLNGVSDTLNLFAQLPPEMQKKLVENLFSKDSEIISLLIFEKQESQPLHSHFHKRYFETYGLNEKNFVEHQIKDQSKIEEILKKGQLIWNASQKNQPPLMGYGKRVLAVDSENNPVQQWVILSYIRLDSLVKVLSVHNISEIQISNAKGEVIVQSNIDQLFEHPLVTNDPFFKQALKSPVKVSVSPIKHQKEVWLSAFAKTFGDELIIVSRSPEKKIFQVVQSLTFRTLLFGTIVLTLVILVAFLISKSLTRNIALLSARMVEVSKGDLITHLKLLGRDETVQLAQSFNTMIDDLKQSRDALEVMNKELDQKVKERTKELEIQNRKVVETQEALLRTTRLASMGEVAGRTAHEVLNPLTSLLTRANLTQKKIENQMKQPLHFLNEMSEAWKKDYSEGGFETLIENWKASSSVYKDQNLFSEDLNNLSEVKQSLSHQTEEIAQDIDFIQREGLRISKIINSMRRLGNINSEIKPHSIHGLIKDCCYIMADLFEQNSIEIRQNLHAEVDLVMIDRDEFIQSLTNMMRNSLQSITSNPLRRENYFKSHIQITTRFHENRIEIDIEDNGSGITEEHQKKLFNSHFTTKSSDEGTGLGLSISRRFLRAYEGDIVFIESQRNQKTVFRIWLPLIAESKGKAVA